MNELPKTIKAFAQHGVFVSEVDGDQALGMCPFCNKQRHFGINVKTQLWDCKHCRKKGNFRQFLERRIKMYQDAMKSVPLARLAKHRRLRKNTLRKWGVGYDPKTEWYMVPLWHSGKLVDIHRYDPETGKGLATSTCKGGLFMIPSSGTQKMVAVCEGEWDAMALWEASIDAGRMLSIVGVAGASRVPKEIADIVVDRDVLALFDKDAAGLEADERLRKIAGQLPDRLRSVQWPTKAKAKYDVRDLWIDNKKDGKAFFQDLDALLRTKPPELKSSVTKVTSMDATKPNGYTGDQPKEPTGKGLSRKKVIEGYRKWLFIPDTDIIDVVFGTIFANRLEGDPVWLFLVGPPGSLKSEMIESASDAPLVSIETDITRQSLVSGMPSLAGDDPSLIPAWNGKVVAISDFTTILTMNVYDRNAIFGILRSAYDGRYTKKFGNKVIRKYKSKFGFLCGVTPVIETYGTAHCVVGERFIKYYIRSTGQLRQGAEAIKQSIENINKEVSMRDDLKAIATQVLDRKIDPKNIPTLTDEIKHRFALLAQWTSAMRGTVTRDKYTQEVVHMPVIEIGSRLVKQFIRLAIGIAIFRQKKTVGFDEFRIAAQAARDTAPDRIERVVHRLYMHASDGWIDAEQISKWTRLPKQTIDKLLSDMTILRLITLRKKELVKQYKLSNTILSMMQPLDLYTKEKQWSRATMVDAEPKKTRRKKGKR